MTSAHRALTALPFLLAVPLMEAAAQQSTVVGATEYAIAPQDALIPGDAIRLSFWREPEFDGEYWVDETGMAVLPLLGQREVIGIAADELKRRLLEEYRKQLRNQDVQIVFLRRVRLLGAVHNPGLYHIDPTMTLGDAVALAGGATRDGKLQGIKIFRDGDEIRSDLDISALVAKEVRSGDQIMVPERSWFARNGAIVIAATITASAVIIANAAF